MNYRIPLFILLFSLALISCSNQKPQTPVVSGSDIPTSQGRCIQHRFVQGQDNNLYGIECVEGKHLLIHTKKTGDRVSTSKAVGDNDGDNDTDGLRLEGTLSFINNIYNPEYTILKDQGNDKQLPFLRNFLPENERFFGSLDTKYRIIFEIKGTYLVLFKASEQLNDLPYIERTSVVKSKDGKYWMVPFLGYPIQYCNAEVRKNLQGQDTYEHLANCQASRLENAKYIRIHPNSKQVYEYHYKEKKDIFPANYFNGRWFFASGPIETPSREGHMSPIGTALVKFQKTSTAMVALDVSGDVENRNRRRPFSLFVQWVDYEPAKNGSNFETFGERPSTLKESISRPYLTINFSKKGTIEVIDFLVTENYLSYILKMEFPTGAIKWKISFLREKAVDTANFVPRKWFKEVHDRYFGTLAVKPQSQRKVGDHSEEDSFEDVRIIRFNTHLNTSEEKRAKTKTIKWYFSKNSTKDSSYRALAREAVQIWNRGFEIITEDSEEKIKLELIDEEKDLGDLRYNLINLVETQDLAGHTGRSVLLGIAPPYVHSNTGQIIGTTANVFIQNFLTAHTQQVKNYIRYEIFQKDKKYRKTKEENDIHVVSPYIRSQIEEQCDDVQKFVNSEKEKNPKPADILQDTEAVLSCARVLSKESVLAVLIHELGHGVGLGHNFKASADEQNYYESIEELKSYFSQARIQEKTEIAQTSSVMDYLPSDVIQPASYLGKYDLAALRFIYRNQVETDQKGEFLPLTIPSEPSLQKNPLTEEILSQRKQYLHCSDSLERNRTTDYFCAKADYGSNPLEVVQFNIEKYKRRFNSFRYRYDVDPEDWQALYTPLYRIIGKVSGFFGRWLQFRDLYLQSTGNVETTKYVLNDDKALQEYKVAIESNSNEEYRSYYAVKDTAYEFFTNWLFTGSMQCQVQTLDGGLKRTINLERITSFFISGQKEHQLYMEDCNSPQIVDFLEKHGLELIGQTGMENFIYYHRPKKDKDSKNLQPWKTTWNHQWRNHPGWRSIFNEPDLFKDFRIKMEISLLDEVEGKKDDDFKRIENIYKTLLSKLKTTLKAESERNILKAHFDDLRTVQFSVGTGEDSVYQRVLKPLTDGLGIEGIAIPFLTASYRDYKETVGEPSIEGFQAFLMKQQGALHIPGESVTIPFQPDSFSSRLILKYNENTGIIQELEDEEERLREKKQELSLLEKIKRDSLKEHNEVLKKIIDSNTDIK